MSKEIFIAGTGAALGTRVEAEKAVENGYYPPNLWAATQIESVRIAEPDQSAPDFAVAAGRIALERSAHAADAVGLLIHARGGNFGGLEGFTPGAYIANAVGLANVRIATEWVAACTGSLSALDLVMPYLREQPEGRAVMITTGDIWPGLYLDRWRADEDQPLGDGGGAMLLSNHTGFARVVGACTVSDYELEGLGRGNESLAPRPPEERVHSISLYRRYSAFIRNTGIRAAEIWERRAALVRKATAAALQTAGFQTAREFDHIVVPSVGFAAFQRDWLSPMGLSADDIDLTTWRFAATTGHLGATDPLAGLHWLCETGRLKQGQRVLVIMDGLGFVTSAAVLEVVSRPRASV